MHLSMAMVATRPVHELSEESWEKLLMSHPFARPPFKHQWETLRFALPRSSSGIFLEMGLGKTGIAVEAARLRMRAKQVKKVLIICPISLFSVWEEEILRSESDADVDVVRESAQFDLRSVSTWTLVNYEKLDRLVLKLLKARFDLVILDEAHRTRNWPSAKTAKAALRLAKGYTPAVGAALPAIPYRLVLTGTPYGDKPTNVWVPVSLVKPNHLGSYRDFVRKYCAKGGFQNREIVGYADLAGLKERVGLVSLRKSKLEVGGLPEKLEQIRSIDLLPDQARAYRELANDLATTLRLLDDRTYRLKVASILAKFVRLQQITSDLACLGTKPYGAKRKELKFILDELLSGTDRKVVIWSLFVPTIEAIVRDCESWGALSLYGGTPMDLRATNVKRFQEDPSVRILVAHPLSAGVGYTFTRADTAIFVDQTPSSFLQKQAEDRIHRIGSQGTVTILRLLAKGTVDEHYAQLVTNKSNITEALTESADLLRRLGREGLLALLEPADASEAPARKVA